MPNNRTKGFLGWAKIIKTGGQTATGPALTTAYSFPIAGINPRNPVNKSYMPVINVAGAPSVNVVGKKTPSITLANIPLKASFWTNIFLSSIIGGSTAYLDTVFNSDMYAIGVNNGSTTRVYDGCKCVSLTLSQQAVGGPILMSQSWLAQYGDSEQAVPTTVTAPVTDAGSLHDITKVDFIGTADMVDMWRLTILRPQGFQHYADATLYSDILQSGAIGGTFSLQQSSLAAIVPSTTVTLKIGGSGGVQIVLNLSKDEYTEDVFPALGTQVNNYTLFNTTGAYPFQISAIA